MNIGMISLGCAKNRVDAETMLGLLKAAGHTIVGRTGDADVVIVNTCGFIQSAKEEAIEAIFEAARDKREGAKLIVTGCLAQRYPGELLHDIPELDAVLGIGEIGEIAAHVKRIAAGGRYREAQRPFAFCEEAARVLTTPRHYAYVKVADGCDNRCAYCAIPGIRGDYISRPIEGILREADGLLEGGAKELILIAQDTTRYGMDLYGAPRLAELTQKLIRPGMWLRAMYFYPEMIDEALLDAMLAGGACRYIDVPIQHASDGVLAAMNRRGGRAAIERAYSLARNRGFALRTTVLVGFPGETKEQFAELLSFLRDHPFDRLGAFAFSREEGTRAALMPGKVPPKLAKEREKAVMEQQIAISRKLLSEKVGTTLSVLTESVVQGHTLGRTEADAPDIDGVVRIAGALPVGEFADIRIVGSSDYDLEGVPA